MKPSRCHFLLLFFAGGAVRAADELARGRRDIVRRSASRAGWVGRRAAVAGTRRDLTAWLSPDQKLTRQTASPGHAADGGVAIAVRSSTPVARPQPQPLHTLLVTGDSLSTPLDIELARELADQGAGVQVIREPHLGTGISKSLLVDWGQLSVDQVAQGPARRRRRLHRRQRGLPDARAEGGKQVECCGADWAADLRQPRAAR